MAAPFSYSAEAQFSKGPGQTTDNFTSLGDGEAKIIHQGSLGSAYADVLVAPIKLTTDAGGWAAGDTCSLYLLVAEDGATGFYTDGIDETSNLDIATSLVEAKHIATIKTEAASTAYYFDEFALSSILGNGSKMPSEFALVLKNGAAALGANLSATAADHYARYRTVSWV